MTGWLLIPVTIIYAAAALDSAWRRNWGMAIVFAGYTLANCGLLVLAERT